MAALVVGIALLCAVAPAAATDRGEPSHPVATTADTAPPAPPSRPPPPDTRQDPVDGVRQLLPRTPRPGPRSAAWLFTLAGIAFGAGALAERARRSLLREGLLPAAVETAGIVCRTIAVVLVIGGIAALVPQVLGPALPWTVLGAALAVGWSLRDVAPDWMAGVVLAVEGNIEPGVWVAGDDFAGSVDKVGLRTTQLVDDHGEPMRVPNRVLVRSALRVLPGHWVPVEIRVPTADGDSHDLVLECAASLPWVAPGKLPAVSREGPDWLVQARLLDGRYRVPFANAVRDRVAEALNLTEDPT